MLVLKRVSYIEGTRGVLLHDGKPVCVTLELPDLQNKRNISCIPTGFYDVNRYSSSVHGMCLFIRHVPDRSSILIHSGNTLADTRGCILVGQGFENDAIINSRKALSNLLTLIPKSGSLPLQILR